MNISEFIGKTFDRVIGHRDRIEFRENTGAVYLMRHETDCCESVTIEDIAGELSWLEGTPILQAEESTSQTDDPGRQYSWGAPDSYTWTYYKLGTIKGYVSIRWYGESNGYYSESVDIYQIEKTTKPAPNFFAIRASR